MFVYSDDDNNNDLCVLLRPVILLCSSLSSVSGSVLQHESVTSTDHLLPVFHKADHFQLWPVVIALSQLCDTQVQGSCPFHDLEREVSLQPVLCMVDHTSCIVCRYRVGRWRLRSAT